jgi:hypothetical protein
MNKEAISKLQYIFYIVPVFSVIISLLVFYWFTPPIINEDNYRYMLSALVQSEAAIVGIVITLSLVAIQLAASSYSPRAIVIFRESKLPWILIGSYTFVILYSSWILMAVESHCVKEIYFSYMLGVFCFALLFPYTYKMLILLEPSEIIRRLSKKITEVNLLKTGSSSFKIGSLQSIFDIVRNSLMRYDYETAIYGLEEARKRICKILKNEELRNTKKCDIDKKIRFFLKNICDLALEREDKYFIRVAVIRNIGEIRKAAEKRNTWMLTIAADVLRILGEGAAERNLTKILDQIILNLSLIPDDVPEKDYVTTIRVVRNIGLVGEAASRQGLRNHSEAILVLLVMIRDKAKKSINDTDDSEKRLIRNVIKSANGFIKKIRRIDSQFHAAP